MSGKISNALKSSILAGVLFFVVANPVTYDLVQSVLGGLGFQVKDAGGATQLGTAIHAVVFGLITFLIMQLARRVEPLSRLSGYNYSGAYQRV